MAIYATVRLLCEHDLVPLCVFFKAIDHQRYKTHFFPHAFSDSEAQKICQYQGKDQYFGVFLQETDQMVGYGFLRGLDEGYEAPSLGLCILDACQGKGLGRMLLSHLLRACERQGAKRAMLKVKRNNRIARSLYENAGFVFESLDQEYLIGYRDLP